MDNATRRNLELAAVGLVGILVSAYGMLRLLEAGLPELLFPGDGPVLTVGGVLVALGSVATMYVLDE